jgi:hypothetical protein
MFDLPFNYLRFTILNRSSIPVSKVPSSPAIAGSGLPLVAVSNSSIQYPVLQYKIQTREVTAKKRFTGFTGNQMP